MINRVMMSNVVFKQNEAPLPNKIDNKPSQKRKLLDKFETSIRNSADMNDTLQVPRTIFKGYLAFMVSTTVVTLASFLNAKHKNLKTGMNVFSALTALYGTYSFVRPYLIKDKK